jgi:hypothetical protein
MQYARTLRPASPSEASEMNRVGGFSDNEASTGSP